MCQSETRLLIWLKPPIRKGTYIPAWYVGPFLVANNKEGYISYVIKDL